jgi:hypothetical protein
MGGTTPGFITEKRFSMLDKAFFLIFHSSLKNLKKQGGPTPNGLEASTQFNSTPELKISSGDDSCKATNSFSNTTESQLHDNTKAPNTQN